MTGVYHHTQLLLVKMGGLENFLPELVFKLQSASKLAKITGVSHPTWPGNAISFLFIYFLFICAYNVRVISPPLQFLMDQWKYFQKKIKIVYANEKNKSQVFLI
jgi:hypothetical protein